VRLAVVLAAACGLRASVLGWLADADVAVWMMVAGGLLIEVEFHRPGLVVAGAAGTALVLLGAFGLSRMPLRPGAVALVALAVAMILLEVRVPTRRVLAFAGNACLVLGLAHLVGGHDAQNRVHWTTAIVGGGGFGVVSFGLAGMARRAFENKRLRV
jgi:membrane-bound serine protease (ClpP class)